VTWLPPLLSFSDFGGDWDSYEEALYEAFCDDWIFGQPPVVFGQRVTIEKTPLYLGKEFAYWHLTSKGKVEENREPDFRRCERIRWVRALLDHVDTPDTIHWENERRGQLGIVVSLPDHSYAVAVRKRRGYLVLKTAFPVSWGHTKRTHEREYRDYSARVHGGT